MLKSKIIKDTTLTKQTFERYTQALIWNRKFKEAETKIKDLILDYGEQNWVLALRATLGMYRSDFKETIADYEQILKNKDSITGQYLSHKKFIEIPKKRRLAKNGRFVEINGASGNNLNNVDLKIPTGSFTCVTGVSGSGKSTLILQTLYHALNLTLNNKARKAPKAFKSYKGVELIDKIISAPVSHKHSITVSVQISSHIGNPIKTSLTLTGPDKAPGEKILCSSKTPELGRLCLSLNETILPSSKTSIPGIFFKTSAMVLSSCLVKAFTE